jgi:lipoprotein-releasing system ATP-binding protein
MVEAKEITKSFGSLHVLKGINLTISDQEIVAIVGPSGAGKTTLLQIMGTLDSPRTGTLTIRNINPFELNMKERASFRNKEIGFVFQFHHLLPEFTALENIMIPALIANLPVEKAKSKAKELADYLKLSERINHKPAELSGGERQRVAVARALINKPSIIFADEPSGSLDTQNKNELHKLFFDLRKETGQTFVIVTHDENLAKLADRVIHINDGLVTN